MEVCRSLGGSRYLWVWYLASHQRVSTAPPAAWCSHSTADTSALKTSVSAGWWYSFHLCARSSWNVSLRWAGSAVTSLRVNPIRMTSLWVWQRVIYNTMVWTCVSSVILTNTNCTQVTVTRTCLVNMFVITERLMIGVVHTEVGCPQLRAWTNGRQLGVRPRRKRFCVRKKKNVACMTSPWIISFDIGLIKHSYMYSDSVWSYYSSGWFRLVPSLVNYNLTTWRNLVVCLEFSVHFLFISTITLFKQPQDCSSVDTAAADSCC